MREKEINQKKMSGMSWVFGGASLNFLIFDKVIAVTGFCILIFADAMAAIIGKSIKSAPFYEKSRAGSLAFFITAIFVILISGLYFDCRLPFYLFAIFIAMFITFTEAYPSFFIVDDNLLIPMTFGISMTLLDFMWHIL
jgi:dolichol kinase